MPLKGEFKFKTPDEEVPLYPHTWQNSGSLNQCWLTFVEKCLRWRTTSVATDREIFLVTKNGCRPTVVLYIWKRFLHRITVIQINGFCCWCVFCALLIFKSIFFFSNNKKGTRKKGGPIFDCIIGKVPKNCKNAFPTERWFWNLISEAAVESWQSNICTKTDLHYLRKVL